MSVLFASWCWQAPCGQWAQAGAFSRRDGACGRIAGFWARLQWPGAHQEPTGSHRKHAWAPKQAPAWVGTCASTPAPLLHLPGPRTPCVALATVSHAYGGSIRVFEAPVKRCRACASTRTCAQRQAQSSAHPGYHPCCHPCTLRGLAQSILGVRSKFLDEENRHEPLSKRSAPAQTPEQHIGSSRKQLPKIGCYPAFSGCALSRR